MTYGIESVTKPRVVILADGKTKPHHSDNRHLIPINGIPLIVRTARQFSDWAQVRVITSDPAVTEAVQVRVPAQVAKGSDETAEYGSLDLFRKAFEHVFGPRTIIVFGDVVFTDQAIQVIKEGNGRSWGIYGRSQGNREEKRWAEYFAVELGMGMKLKAVAALRAVLANYRAKKWPTAGPWEWYREMEGLVYYAPDKYNVEVGEHWVEINDETDDIDFDEEVPKIQEIFK